jgi:ABC-type transport system substrate-binding protein
VSDSYSPAPVTLNHLHWHTNDLLEVPPVLLSTEMSAVRLRQALATYIDGRHVNDALYRAVLALRREFSLRPYAYVVTFPHEGFEIPIDLRPIAGDPGRLAGIVKEPRSVRDVPFDYAEIEGNLADHLAKLTREEAVQVLKQMSSDGQEFTISDRCSDDERFAHHFIEGAYRHNYRYVASLLPEVER